MPINPPPPTLGDSNDATVVDSMGEVTPRRMLAKDDDGYSGLQIRRNDSKISFGTAGDVEFKRTGEGELHLTGNLLMQELSDKTGSDVLDIRAALEALQAIATGTPPSGMCFDSCLQAKEKYPKAETGVYCINVATDATEDLYCDMDTLGGGWTYVARGTDSSDGCQTGDYGSSC